jgi:hypothetical protein
MKLQRGSRQAYDRCITRCRFLGTLAALFLALNAAAETFELTTATIADINKAFDSGALNSEQLVQLSLARIAAYDEAGPKLNAVMLLNPDAMETARALDREDRSCSRARYRRTTPSWCASSVRPVPSSWPN